MADVQEREEDGGKMEEERNEVRDKRDVDGYGRY